MFTDSIVILSIASFIVVQGWRPCTQNGGPYPCDANRVQPCGTYNAAYYNAEVIPVDAYGSCSNEWPKLYDAMSWNQYYYNRYLVQFDDYDGNCFEILMFGGECWGMHPTNGGNYDCQGRCGGGCGYGAVCSNWARSCLKHDVCSWYFGSSGGAFDQHCGDEFRQAQNDYLQDCITGNACNGGANSCSSSSAMRANDKHIDDSDFSIMDDNNDGGADAKGLNVMQGVGIGIAAVLLFCVVVGLSVFVYRRKSAIKSSQSDVDNLEKANENEPDDGKVDETSTEAMQEPTVELGVK